jgi:N-acetylneuraminic acid mutarotase
MKHHGNGSMPFPDSILKESLMRIRISLLAILSWASFVSAQETKLAFPSLPEAISSFGAAVSDGYIYVYGGHIGKTHTYSTEAVTGKFRRLNLANPSKWEELPAGPAIQGLALVAHGGKIYRIGGMQPRNKVGDPSDNISLATCARFDPKVGKWEPMPDLPAGRSSHDAAVLGDAIVVVGGWQMHGGGKKSVWHDTALVLDLSKKTPTWEPISQPFQRRALNAASLDGKVYVVGGLGAESTERKVDVLNLKSRKWTAGPTLPGVPRNGFSPAVCNQGGTLFASPSDGKLYQLSLKHDAWVQIDNLEKPRQVHRIVPGPNASLVVLGGASKDGNVAQVEVITTFKK